MERSLTVLQAVFAEVFISSNKAELYEGFEAPVILDVIAGRGPLEGLYQGLKKATYDEVFFLACDILFLNAELIRFMSTWIPAYDVVVPSLQSGLHPLHAFYHRRCLPLIKNSLDADRLKVVDLYPSCSVRYVNETELQNFNNLSQLFCNINTQKINYRIPATDFYFKFKKQDANDHSVVINAPATVYRGDSYSFDVTYTNSGNQTAYDVPLKGKVDDTTIKEIPAILDLSPNESKTYTIKRQADTSANVINLWANIGVPEGFIDGNMSNNTAAAEKVIDLVKIIAHVWTIVHWEVL